MKHPVLFLSTLIRTLKRDWFWPEQCDTIEDTRVLCARAAQVYNTEHPIPLWECGAHTNSLISSNYPACARTRGDPQKDWSP
jgi:hypothetical protein